MGIKAIKQTRCTYRYAGSCRRAGGVTFLVLDFLLWTQIGMCRLCAVEVRPDLIYLTDMAIHQKNT